jgi:hypothetical protein
MKRAITVRYLPRSRWIFGEISLFGRFWIGDVTLA